jgi:hypothetical protein
LTIATAASLRCGLSLNAAIWTDQYARGGALARFHSAGASGVGELTAVKKHAANGRSPVSSFHSEMRFCSSCALAPARSYFSIEL